MAMRHGKKVAIWGWQLVLDAKDNEFFVLRDAQTQEPVARQTKGDAGRRYQQGTNPDREGHLAYPLEFKVPYLGDGWASYSDCARKGDLLSTRFLERLAEAHGHKRPQ